MMEKITGATSAGVIERLNDWDDEVNPLAPLSDAQLESIAKLMEIVNEQYPPSSTLNEAFTLKSDSSPLPSDVEKFEALKLCDSEKPVVVENSSQFLSWFGKVEENILDDDDTLFKAYTKELEDYRDQFHHLLNDVTSALDHLNSLQKQYCFVSNKTNALHEACEHLIAEQTELVDSAEDIAVKLCYFNELEVLSQKLNSPTLSVMSESFVPILARLDECIAYLDSNPQCKEASTYLASFKQLQSQALGMIQSYVVNTLQQTTQQLLPKQENLLPSENAFTLFYGKFRTYSPRIHNLMEQIEERVEKNADYQQLLSNCHRCYFAQRELLLGPSVSAAINKLASNHQRDHCALVRSGCAFLAHVCEDEYQLFHQFFSQPTKQLDTFLENLCTRLYDVLRPVIIHINHLETLAELCSILKVEMLEEHVNSGSIELKAFEKVISQMLEDVQERLVYRTHIYIHSDILNYKPSPGDLAYPDKLQMMESIAESLALGTLSRSSSQSSVASGAHSTFGAPAVTGNGNITHDHAAVLPISSSEQVMEKSLTGQLESPPSEPSVRPRTTSYSPADLHGMWYPTVRRTLVCLSKLYRCLDKTIFQGLSQEVLTMCIQSLIAASQSITKNKTLLDGQLFQIKHLLILREQIAPFQIDFAIKETTLDFSKIKSAAYNLFQKKTQMFSLSSNNALLEFLLQGTPQVTEHLIDSKKAVNNQLKLICEEFISTVSEMLLGPLLIFLNKAKVINQVQAEGSSEIALSNQPFASPEKLAELVSEVYRNLKIKLVTLQQSMALYLANPDTEYILFRPIKTRIQNSFEQLIQLVKTSYSEEEQIIIACPSQDQINILLSSAVTTKR